MLDPLPDHVTLSAEGVGPRLWYIVKSDDSNRQPRLRTISPVQPPDLSKSTSCLNRASRWKPTKVDHEYSWPPRVSARTHTSSSPSDSSVTSLTKQHALNFQMQHEDCLHAWRLCVEWALHLFIDAESSCLDLDLPYRTSKEQDHKELG